MRLATYNTSSCANAMLRVFFAKDQVAHVVDYGDYEDDEESDIDEDVVRGEGTEQERSQTEPRGYKDLGYVSKTYRSSWNTERS